jgi:acyl-CoA oxidase
VDGVSKVDGNIALVLRDVCLLYGLYTIEDNAGAFLQCQYFSPAQIEIVRSQVNALCKTVRDQAIPLVDAFNLSDYMINSPLGRKDGNVYVHYFNQVQQSNPQGDHPYFERLIKPMIHRMDDEDDDEQAGLEDDDDEDDD